MITRRASTAAWLLALWITGYFFLIPDATSPRHARDLATPIDNAIPFLAWTVWIYLAGMPLIAAPLFALRSEAAFRRASLDCAVILLASFACFAVLPVSSPGLRDAAAMADPGGVTTQAIRLVHALDPPGNLFPSLHVSLAALACWSVAKALPRWRLAFWAALAMVICSVTTTKQHLLIDVAGGLALAWAVYANGHLNPAFPPAVGMLLVVLILFGLLYWNAV